jgi:hypothetical protein
MGHLRHKLEADPTRQRALVTEPSMGYQCKTTERFCGNLEAARLRFDTPLTSHSLYSFACCGTVLAQWCGEWLDDRECSLHARMIVALTMDIIPAQTAPPRSRRRRRGLAGSRRGAGAMRQRRPHLLTIFGGHCVLVANILALLRAL